MTGLGAEEASDSLATGHAAQEEIPVDWAHTDGLSGAMVKTRKTFEDPWLEYRVSTYTYLNSNTSLFQEALHWAAV